MKKALGINPEESKKMPLQVGIARRATVGILGFFGILCVQSHVGAQEQKVHLRSIRTVVRIRTVDFQSGQPIPGRILQVFEVDENGIVIGKQQNSPGNVVAEGSSDGAGQFEFSVSRVTTRLGVRAINFVGSFIQEWTPSQIFEVNPSQTRVAVNVTVNRPAVELLVSGHPRCFTSACFVAPYSLTVLDRCGLYQTEAGEGERTTVLSGGLLFVLLTSGFPQPGEAVSKSATVHFAFYELPLPLGAPLSLDGDVIPSKCGVFFPEESEVQSYRIHLLPDNSAGFFQEGVVRPASTLGSVFLRREWFPSSHVQIHGLPKTRWNIEALDKSGSVMSAVLVSNVDGQGED